MGNFSISCCRSKPTRLNSDRGNGGDYRADGQYSETNRRQVYGGKRANNEAAKQGGSFDPSNQPSNILQHISEREPDDSETDPSSNAYNRPIFAARSSYTKNRTSTYNDSYSSNNSRQRSNTTPLTVSQDHGYNSTTSTNLTQYDGQLIITDSFDNSIQHQNRQAMKESELNSSVFSGKTNNTDKSVDDSRLLLTSSQTNSDDNDYLSSSGYELKLSQDCRKPNSNIMKSSSCSTIFTDGSTISQPNLRQTIQCVSLAVYYHIKNRTSDDSDEIFDESLHPLKIPAQNNADDCRDELLYNVGDNDNPEKNLDEPDQKTIHSFVKTLFNAAQLTSEYAITTLVYLERLMTYAEMDLTPKTWRRMFLGAIVLSSKVWEDQAVWNVDYAQILEGISVDDINELERQYLELIQFNMNVPSSVYAKYYFHLRTLAMKNGISSEHTLLTVGKAKDLEAMSSAQITDWQSSPIHRKSSPAVKMHTSLEKLRFNGRARAVLM